MTARRPARSMTIDSKVTMSQTMVKKAGSNSADAIFMFPKGATLPHTHQLEGKLTKVFKTRVNAGAGHFVFLILIDLYINTSVH